MLTFVEQIRKLVEVKDTSTISGTDQLKQMIYEMIMMRKGEVITHELAMDRAGNIAQSIGYAVNFEELFNDTHTEY